MNLQLYITLIGRGSTDPAAFGPSKPNEGQYAPGHFEQVRLIRNDLLEGSLTKICRFSRTKIHGVQAHCNLKKN